MRATTFTIIGLLLIAGCSKGPQPSGGPDDEFVRDQVTAYLTNRVAGGGIMGRSVPFRQFFELIKVEVVDRQIDGKGAVVVCNLTTKVTAPYAADSMVGMAYSRYVGGGAGSPGQVRTGEASFNFAKYEKGWRFKGPTKPELF